jgi:hypothetical protein
MELQKRTIYRAGDIELYRDANGSGAIILSIQGEAIILEDDELESLFEVINGFRADAATPVLVHIQSSIIPMFKE